VSDKPVKIIVSKDPVVIGQTKEGEPIWLDMKDLIPTPDEELERWDKTLDARQQALINRAAHMVLDNSCRFLEITILETIRPSVMQQILQAPADQAGRVLLGVGYTVVQDGLKTIVKFKGKVLREMTANISLRYRGHVAKRVNQIVRNVGHQIAQSN
jgi:hypothetical protein